MCGITVSENSLSIEEGARESRYRYLFEQARRINAQAVATGHTADDQAETVLMHFLRGSGVSGLKGMKPYTILSQFDPGIPLIRPLLQTYRQETEQFLSAKWDQVFSMMNRIPIPPTSATD